MGDFWGGWPSPPPGLPLVRGRSQFPPWQGIKGGRELTAAGDASASPSLQSHVTLGAAKGLICVPRRRRFGVL